jgi:hypothetical protein
VHLWIVQPWFDEGEDYPEESGTPSIIEADTREAAEDAFLAAAKFSSLAYTDVMTPAEWQVRGGYQLPGLGPTPST